MSSLVILATNVKIEHEYRVIFTGPNADAMAVAWIKAHQSTHAIGADDDFDWQTYPLTAEALNPTCEHGLSERLCAGPNHYPTHL
jgi:hypothetical protein